MNACRVSIAISLVLALRAWGGAMEELAAVDHFAFGGVGFAGTTSKGEIAFRKVMGDRAAREELLKTLEKGSAAAQCYALAGLHAVDRASFDEKVKRFEKDSREVTTIGGCIIGKEPMSSVVANISRGQFDGAVRNPAPTRPAGK